MELGGGVWIGWSTPGCSGRIQVSVSINPGLWTGEKGSRRQVPTCTGTQGREVLFGYEQQPFSEVSFNLVCVCVHVPGVHHTMRRSEDCSYSGSFCLV